MPRKKQPNKNSKQSKETSSQNTALVFVPRPAQQSTGRKCKCCSHPSVKKINSMISKGDSFRRISSHFGMFSDRSVGRHAEKCLNLEIRALIKENKVERAIDHYEEIKKLLDFALELKDAAREMLVCDELDRVSFMPRAEDINVIYDDLTENDMFGRPIRKTRHLQSIINAMANIPEIKNVQAVVKTQDLKDYGLRTIAAVDVVLDKVAKVEGLYKEQQKIEPVEKHLRQIKAIAARTERPLDEILEKGIERKIIPEQFRHELREKIAAVINVSEAVN